jgi:mycothiol synthase
MFSVRRYQAALDLSRLCEIVLESSMATLNAGDILLKLNDPSLNPEKDICLWEDDGRLVGFAFVQLSCAEFNFAIKSCTRPRELASQIMAWALKRLRSVAEDRGCLTLFFTSVREDDHERISLLELHGFARHEQHYIYLHRTLASPIPPPNLPAGFTVRNLTGAHELKAYVAAHRNALWMDNLTEQWYRRLLESPDYIPELNLVVVAPDGEFAACCLGWLEQNEKATDGLKKGYVQTVGTRIRFQNMGLGRAIFLEVLRRLQALGARVMECRTGASNMNSLRICESVGLRPLHKIYLYFWASDVCSENKA